MGDQEIPLWKRMSILVCVPCDAPMKRVSQPWDPNSTRYECTIKECKAYNGTPNAVVVTGSAYLKTLAMPKRTRDFLANKPPPLYCLKDDIAYVPVPEAERSFEFVIQECPECKHRIGSIVPGTRL